MKLHSTPCLYYLCPLITTLWNWTTDEKRMMQSNVQSFFFFFFIQGDKKKVSLVSGAQTNSGGLIHASLMNSSRTSVMLMHVKEYFDFCNVWARAPHQICCSGKGEQMAVIRDATHKPRQAQSDSHVSLSLIFHDKGKKCLVPIIIDDYCLYSISLHIQCL